MNTQWTAHLAPHLPKLVRAMVGRALICSSALLVLTVPAIFAATAPGNWQVVPSANPPAGPIPSELLAVSAVSDTDIWAVGYDHNDRALTEHWDGSAWTIVPAPSLFNPGYQIPLTILRGVAAIASNDAWAVGDDTSGHIVAEHWDGSAWSIVPTPAVGFGILRGVAAAASNDVWAVGTDINTDEVLILHWDGNHWERIPVPLAFENIPFIHPGLYGIKALARNNVWAVGDYVPPGGGTAPRTLILHWDGISWSQVDSPNIGPLYQSNGLNAIDGVTADDLWAIGTAVLHWDGISWSVVPTPSTLHLTFVRGVAAVAASNAWVVGRTEPFCWWEHCAYERDTLIEHWDGISWSIVLAPSPTPGQSSLSAVTLARTTAWAVGESSAQPLVLMSGSP